LTELGLPPGLGVPGNSFLLLSGLLLLQEAMMGLDFSSKAVNFESRIQNRIALRYPT